MNTKFFLYIFALLTTGTVLAYDVPPIVRKALTQEERQNAQEGKAVHENIKEHRGNTLAMMKGLGFALQNDTDKTSSILDQLSPKHEDESIDVLSHVRNACAIAGAIILAYVLGGRHGYNQAYWRGHTEGSAALLERVLQLGADAQERSPSVRINLHYHGLPQGVESI